MKRVYAITKNSFINFLERLSSVYNVVIPYQIENNYTWINFKGEFNFNDYRCISSIRQFFLPCQELISINYKDIELKKRPFCIVGAKNCDIQSLKIQDYVFLKDEVDESYNFFRKNNVIISSDCRNFKEVCFCLNLNIKPYPEENYDLNLSLVDDVYLIEVGSEKGDKLIKENSNFFQEPPDTWLEKNLELRKNLEEKLSKQIILQGLVNREVLYQLVKSGYENNIWQEEAEHCVECGACIMNCPTCHCFLLFDDEENKNLLRGRTWDGCQYKNFAKVAGGANPLLFRSKRLRNRYIKKFEFFPDRLGIYACTGCGRCIECCPGKIDLRNIFKRLKEDSKLSKL
ncbi:MAG: 4Fe-4S dicluster domain-containing protein [Candidatus Omnitrophica bacterium]|nr:4Fe-4S dicluster domain-containing protein [Candidatus Omnitrophota bacterium]